MQTTFERKNYSFKKDIGIYDLFISKKISNQVAIVSHNQKEIRIAQVSDSEMTSLLFDLENYDNQVTSYGKEKVRDLIQDIIDDNLDEFDTEY